MSKLTAVQSDCAKLIRRIIKDDDAYVGTMLMLIVDQQEPDNNCRQMIEFLNQNPNAGYDEVMEKADLIVGIE